MIDAPGYSAVAQEAMKLRSHSLGVDPTPAYAAGDAVGAQHPDLETQQGPVYGRLSHYDQGWHIRTATGEISGPWDDEHLFFDVTAHVDYPHHPGTLHDCPGCEVLMAAEGFSDHDESA